MNHQAVYDKIITHFQKLNLKKDPKNNPGAIEEHHIIPAGLGGGDNKENLVLLPVKAHFTVHHLLSKIHGGSMSHAFNLMCRTRDGVSITAKVFERVKKESAEFLIGCISGDNHWTHRIGVSDEMKRNMSIGQTGKKLSEQHIEQIRQNSTGRKHTEEAKELMSVLHSGKNNPMSGVKHTQEVIDKMSGENNSSYDHTIYTLIHKDGRVFKGTQYNFTKQYDSAGRSFSKLKKGTLSTLKGWHLEE